jgi:hypothetical protein
MYKVPIHLIISSLIIGIISGIIIGYIITILIPLSSMFSLFTLAAATFIAILSSSIIFSILNFTTNGKRGKKIQIISITTMFIISFSRIYFGGEISLITSDLNGAVILLIGSLILWDRFR